jgi:hypothetical protein
MARDLNWLFRYITSDVKAARPACQASQSANIGENRSRIIDNFVTVDTHPLNPVPLS